MTFPLFHPSLSALTQVVPIQKKYDMDLLTNSLHPQDKNRNDSDHKYRKRKETPKMQALQEVKNSVKETLVSETDI